MALSVRPGGVQFLDSAGNFVGHKEACCDSDSFETVNLLGRTSEIAQSLLQVDTAHKSLSLQSHHYMFLHAPPARNLQQLRQKACHILHRVAGHCPVSQCSGSQFLDYRRPGPVGNWQVPGYSSLFGQSVSAISLRLPRMFCAATGCFAPVTHAALRTERVPPYSYGCRAVQAGVAPLRLLRPLWAPSRCRRAG